MTDTSPGPPDPPTDETLVALAAGELDAASAAAVEAALAHVPEIAGRAGSIRAIVHELQADRSVAPPEGALDRAFRIPENAAVSPALPPLAERLGAAADHVRRVIAELLIDSRRDLAAGLRGPTAAHHRMYDSPLGRIDLEISAAGPDERHLAGQVTWQESGGSTTLVALAVDGGREAARIDADAFGCFECTLPVGHYDLKACRGDLEIVVGALAVE